MRRGRRIPIRDQVAELERLYRQREAMTLKALRPPFSRADPETRLRQDRLLAAWRSLAWLAEHSAVLRGYIEFCAPFVRHSDDWSNPPNDLHWAAGRRVGPENDDYD